MAQAGHALEQQHRAATGQALPRPRGPVTPAEVAALEAQGRYRSSDLSVEEQEQLKGELVGMWRQIPKHLMPKLAEWEKKR